MADEKDGKTGVTVAKRHQLLQDIALQTKGSELTDTCMVAGHAYLLSNITADEEVWADGYVNASTPLAAVSSVKLPYLAAAIKSIDAVPVEQLFDFVPEDSNKAFHIQSIWHKRYWLMSQLLLWLGDRPPPFIEDLWTCYIQLTKRRTDSWEQLKKASAGTPGGESKASS